MPARNAASPQATSWSTQNQLFLILARNSMRTSALKPCGTLARMPKAKAPTKRTRVDTTVGPSLRAARHRAGLTQRQLAGDRYTAAYISALEVGLVRPSWAALTYLSGRLGLPVHDLVRESRPGWDRLSADLHLAAGDWETAADRYSQLLESAPVADSSSWE